MCVCHPNLLFEHLHTSIVHTSLHQKRFGLAACSNWPDHTSFHPSMRAHAPFA